MKHRHEKSDLDAEAAEVAMSAAPQDEAIKTALAAWAGADPEKQASAHRVSRAWLISDKKSRNLGHKRNRISRVASHLALVASVALLFGGAYLFDVPMRASADLVAGLAGEMDAQLHPGVIADLDALTALKVDADGDQVALEVLRGGVFVTVDPEANLEVSVLANGALTSVRGTAFSVERSPSAVTVAVVEGSVETHVKQGKTWSLSGGQQLHVESGNGVLSDIAPDDVAAWRDGFLIANDLTLSEIARRLDARHLGVIVIADSTLASARVTGAFRLDDPVDAIRAAAAPHGGSVTLVTPFLTLIR